MTGWLIAVGAVLYAFGVFCGMALAAAASRGDALLERASLEAFNAAAREWLADGATPDGG